MPSPLKTSGLSKQSGCNHEALIRTIHDGSWRNDNVASRGRYTETRWLVPPSDFGEVGRVVAVLFLVKNVDYLVQVRGDILLGEEDIYGC